MIFVGSEFVSKIAAIGIFNLTASFTAMDSILVSIIKSISGIFFICEIPPNDLFNLSLSLPNFNNSFLVKPLSSFDKSSSNFFNLFIEF